MYVYKPKSLWVRPLPLHNPIQGNSVFVLSALIPCLLSTYTCMYMYVYLYTYIHVYSTKHAQVYYTCMYVYMFIAHLYCRCNSLCRYSTCTCMYTSSLHMYIAGVILCVGVQYMYIIMCLYLSHCMCAYMSRLLGCTECSIHVY